MITTIGFQIENLLLKLIKENDCCCCWFEPSTIDKNNFYILFESWFPIQKTKIAYWLLKKYYLLKLMCLELMDLKHLMKY